MGGGGSTTNITNTGLGDEQFGVLTTNQTNIGSSIDSLGTGLQDKYFTLNTRFDQSRDRQNSMSDALGSKGYTYDFGAFGDGFGLSDAITAGEMANGSVAQDLKYDFNGDGTVDQLDYVAGVSKAANNNPNTVDTGLYREFADQTQAMTDQFGNVIAGQGDLNRTIGQQAIGTQNVIGGNLDTLGQTMGGRFDTVDTNVGNVQGAVDQGFIDQGQRFDTLDTSVGGVQTAVDAGNDANTKGFVDATAAMGTGFGDASTQLTNAQSAITEGQGGIVDNLDAFSGRADTYATSALQNQADLQSAQDGFQSNFDSFTERYGEDTELAQQSRADLATAQSNQTDRLREDMGAYAQAAATGQANLGTQLGDVATGVGAEFENLGSNVETGFSQAGTDALASQENLTTRLGNLGTIMTTTGANIDANTQQQYEALSSSFDDNGQLIQNSITENGDTISRQMDDQGNIIATRFDQSGNQVDQVNMNVNEMLTQAENYQRDLTGQIQGVGGDLTGQIQGVGGDLTGQLQGVGDDLTGQLQGVGDGLMSGQADTEALAQKVGQNQSTTNNAVTDIQQAMAGGFDKLDGGQISQARDLAKIASAQTDLDMNMRQDFNQLGTAFSDNGELIRNSIDEQGNTISRAMDEQGNLLLRSFDVTGKQIGNKVININRSLIDLSNLQTIQGGNASMGNLSPAMSNAVPTSGFASPFAITR